MKNIILLEDQPERLGTLIRQLQEPAYQNIVQVTTILCYGSSENWDKDSLNLLREKLSSLCNMEGIDCIRTDIWNFDELMDKLYSSPLNGFIFDTQLFPGKDIDVFDFRINISYALKKNADNKIWFYTLAGQYYEYNIRSRFGDYVIEAEETKQGIILQLQNSTSFQQWIHE